MRLDGQLFTIVTVPDPLLTYCPLIQARNNHLTLVPEERRNPR